MALPGCSGLAVFDRTKFGLVVVAELLAAGVVAEHDVNRIDNSVVPEGTVIVVPLSAVVQFAIVVRWMLADAGVATPTLTAMTRTAAAGINQILRDKIRRPFTLVEFDCEVSDNPAAGPAFVMDIHQFHAARHVGELTVDTSCLAHLP